MSTKPFSPPIDGQVMNCLLRMMTPMRREFDMALNIDQFMQDPGYANQILKHALGSQDSRLRGYASQLKQLYRAPREGVRETPGAHGKTAASSNQPPVAMKEKAPKVPVTKK